MSSPASFPSPSECDAALSSAVAEVAETSFFGFVDPCDDPAAFAALVASESAWLRTSVRFAGPTLHGEVTLMLPTELGTQLTAAFAGLDTTDLTPSMVRDAIGELANMVCGLWLTRRHPRDRFALARPEVADLDEPVMAAWLPILINDRPVWFGANLGVQA